jgi:hypothetical protein
MSSHVTILNADGVYVATIATLLLNLKLIQTGYYSSKDVLLLPQSQVCYLD